MWPEQYGIWWGLPPNACRVTERRYVRQIVYRQTAYSAAANKARFLGACVSRVRVCLVGGPYLAAHFIH